MAHAYTPGLKVLHETKIDKERRLPLKGTVTVEKGKFVTPDDIVAKTDLPGNVQMVNVANQLNIDAEDVNDAMIAKEGTSVIKGEMIAETKGLFGLFKTNVTAPVDGTIEVISDTTGQVVIREAPIPVEIDAYMSGSIKNVIPEEGVVIESEGVFIQGIFGIGGESRGDLAVIVDNREDEITEEMLTSELEGKIIVGGSFISLKAYKKAIQLKVAGVVVGGLMIDVCIRYVPTPENYIYQILLGAFAVFTVGIGGGIYLVSNLGAGPRDGLMIGKQGS